MNTGERRSAVRRECIGIEEYFRRALSFLAIEHALVLQAVILIVVSIATFLKRRRVLLVIPQLLQAPCYGVAVWYPAKVGVRYLVLIQNPLMGLFGSIVFKPAIRIAH